MVRKIGSLSGHERILIENAVSRRFRDEVGSVKRGMA